MNISPFGVSKKCKIIVIEGPDRVGKNTQSNMLTDYLKGHGYVVRLVEVPVQDKLTYRLIYWMLKNGLAIVYPRVFQTLQFLNKLFFQLFTLPGMSRKSDYIVLDRWSLSSLVYGMATGIDKKFCDRYFDLLIKPNMTIVLDGKPLIKETEDVYESDASLQCLVRAFYVAWTLSQSEKTAKLIKNDDTTALIHSQIVDTLSKNLI